MFPKRTEKPPIQTVKQIERLIRFHTLTEEKADEIWEAAYLDTAELNELLEYVRVNARYDFLYPMCLTAAHTGARRSELSGCKVADLDLTGAAITIHERKRSKGARTTRMLPLSEKLKHSTTRLPITVARVPSFKSSISFMVARAAAQETGFPP